MHLSIIHIFNKCIAKPLEGISVQLKWIKEDGQAFVTESFSDQNGQAFLTHTPKGQAKILVNSIDYGFIDTPCLQTIIMKK